jgi:type IV secretory pathway VirB2 component (pilin)
MKKIKNKKVIKKKLSHHCKAALLSLFVMLTIPSISSGIFGNGDAEAACIERSGYIGQSVDVTAAIVEHSAFCNKVPAVPGDKGSASGGNCTVPGLKVNGVVICNSTTASGSTVGTCTPVTGAKIRCSGLNTAQCQSVSDITTYCQWVAEDTDNNKLVDAICRVYQIATGTAGKAFAAVGVISVGIGFFTGKVSWGLMISVAAGIAVFFGAPSIISVISGSDASNLCSNVGGRGTG